MSDTIGRQTGHFTKTEPGPPACLGDHIERLEAIIQRIHAKQSNVRDAFHGPFPEECSNPPRQGLMGRLADALDRLDIIEGDAESIRVAVAG
jgi:hypothetical protein